MDTAQREAMRFAFPEGIKRVTAGHGGEAILIIDSKQTALVDCGMAYCAGEVTENIKRELQGRPLDYILLSHTHYDHLGALPQIKEAYPQAVCWGSEHGQKVLTRPGALQVIKELGEAAQKEYAPDSRAEIRTDGLSIDRAVKQGDRIPFGSGYFDVLETKGHTDCSLTYIWQPRNIMFASESTGIPERSGVIHTAILKDFRDSVRAADLCRGSRPDQVIFPHYGILPGDEAQAYWQRYKDSVYEEKAFLNGLKEQGKSEEEILEAYSSRYWTEAQQEEQPRAAFKVNAKYIIRAMLRAGKEPEEK